jgi:O-antigen ligase
MIFATFSVRSHTYNSNLSSLRSSESRITLLRLGIDMFIKHPFVGVGRGAVELSTRTGSGYYAHEVSVSGPPNQLLFALDEGGILEGGCLIMFYACSLMISIRQRSLLGIALLSSWGVMAATSFVDIVFGAGSSSFTPINYVVGMLTGATLMTEPAKQEPDQTEHERWT